MKRFIVLPPSLKLWRTSLALAAMVAVALPASLAYAGVFDQEQTVTNSPTRNYKILYGDAEAAQSFKPGFNYGNFSILLLLGNVGTPPRPLVIEIRSDNSGVPSSTILLSNEIAPGDITSYKWYEIGFLGNQTVLKKDVTYWIVCYQKYHWGDVNNRYDWEFYDGASQYARGLQAYSVNAGNSWTTYTNRDFCFRTWAETNTAPPAPTLSSPANGATGLALKPTLTCNTVSDPDGNPVVYVFQVDDNSDFSSPLFTDAPGSGIGTAGAVSYVIGTDYAGSLTANTTYYWRVKSNDGCLESDYSGSWNFTTIGPFTFVHITDLHGGGARFRLLRDSIMVLNPKPLFVVLSGDLVSSGCYDAGGGNYRTLTTDLTKYNNQYYLDAGKTVPIYCAPGNHDYRYWLLSSPTNQRYGDSINEFMNLDVNSNRLGFNGTDGGFAYYWKKTVKPGDTTLMISLCTGSDILAYEDYKIPEGTGLTTTQLTWLSGVLKGNQTCNTRIIFMHHPPVDNAGYPTDGTIYNNRTQFLDTCAKYNVNVVLHGHKHRSMVLDKSGNIQDENWTGGVRYVNTDDAKDYNYRVVTVTGTTVNVSTPKKFQPQWTISGFISGTTKAGVPGAWVAVVDDANDSIDCKGAYSDAYGNYAISGVPDGGYYVAAFKSGTNFTPATQYVNISGADNTGKNFTGDNTPPVVSITAPANGETVSGTKTITATATDNVGVDSVVFYVDGSRIGKDNASPYTYDWNTKLYANGSHALAANAYDAANNVGTSATVNVISSNDLTPPIVSITNPADGSTVSGITTITASATDNVGVTKVDFYIDGTLRVTDNTSPYSYDWNTAEYGANYRNSLVVKAYDAANNVGTAGVNVVSNNYSVVKNNGFETGAFGPQGSSDNWSVNGLNASVKAVDPRIGTYVCTVYKDIGVGGQTFVKQWIYMPWDACYLKYYLRAWKRTSIFGPFDGQRGAVQIIDGSTTTTLQSFYTGFGGPEIPWREYIYDIRQFAGKFVTLRLFVTNDHNVYSSAVYVHWDNIRVTDMSGIVKSPIYNEQAESENQKPSLPTVTRLLTCAPNPTTGANNISYQLSSSANVSLKVYNIQGQLVKTLANETRPAGYHSVKWDGKDANGNKVAAGVYLYRMSAGDYSATRKMTVIR